MISFKRCWIGIWLLLSSGTTQAEPFIEHVAPPVIEKGKTVRCTFVGRDLAGALDLWTSLSPGALKAKPIESQSERAVFDIESAGETPVGIFGLRVATKDGLSNVHLFLVDDLPVRPRESSGTPMITSLPAAVWGTFREAAIDRYQIEVTAGQRVSFEVVGSRFGKDADPLLTIRDARRPRNPNQQGALIVERDNDQGLYYDVRFEHQFKEGGVYEVQVRDARFRGSEHHPYVLRMGRFPAGRVAVPSAVNAGANRLRLPETNGADYSFDCPPMLLPGPFMAVLRHADDEGSTWLPLTTTQYPIATALPRDEPRAMAQALTVSPAVILAFNWSPLRANPFLSIDALLPSGRAQATSIMVPSVVCGTLKKPGERHSFCFGLAKGQSIYVRGESQALNSPADLDIILTDRTGKEVRRATELRGEASLNFTANARGTFGLQVRDATRDGGDAFAYRLTVDDKPFSPVLTAEVEGLVVPQGSYQPIPVTVTRSGPAGLIKLKLLGAPAGMTLTPSEIPEKETSVVCKLEAGATTPLGIATIQILAEGELGEMVLVRTQPVIDKQLVNVDLIPLALREDQRRLPPSVADRLAVHVIPPSPFAFELADSAITLPRYHHADIPIITTRQPNFDGPISFTAKGGQLADKNEGRTRVYAEFPTATPGQTNVTGSIHSRILSNLGTTRIEVTGTGVHQGRRFSLTRVFELKLTTAFTVASEPAKIALLPGESATMRVNVKRLPSFVGAVTLNLLPIPGIELPETVVIAQGQDGVNVVIKAPTDAQPRKQALQWNAAGTVNGYEEQLQRVGSTELEIRKVELPKKK